ncbi:phosphoadenylyl-sulfate reductase [Piscinibacter sakaiensis]|uniref:Adenosine 5'-phosphosulfate reductase n=1 Tax=Piscinibacter sakaiensis TaxID=1547922 RepID=A0A0K8NZ89_PISS1|nr:phosphoadenylyl-sulfate reductase [Piscinibacter sakaiensis]GAP35688.1 phosphoadenylyl-sulfate reductase [thioredoxin] /adenylyl-sulfate reductase [thioredoxin] [Piscinibacter sakaiensis]
MSVPGRPASAIALYARETPGHAQRVDGALRLLREAAAQHAGRIVQATSLGAEDMVVTDLIARHALPIDLATLDTGMLHPETLALLPVIAQHYGRTVAVFRPDPVAADRFVQLHGDAPMRQSIALRKACCALRKLEPLERLLDGRSAWVTGLRREQSQARGEVAPRGADDRGREKLNPLADWSWADVWHYIQRHAVPFNPLHDAYMPSIGCAPCTRAIAVGEDFRAGRWWWEDEAAKECGLHVPASASPLPATPTGAPA